MVWRGDLFRNWRPALLLKGAAQPGGSGESALGRRGRARSEALNGRINQRRTPFAQPDGRPAQAWVIGEIAHGQFFMNGGGTLLSQGGLLKGFELGK
ncbi:hypothetical protein PMM47T1_19206 [Pseudomonas sp. M47T1]|nr:hypothetical protein PMM47T1_19206 [Pseudomonas sp. M47T1]